MLVSQRIEVSRWSGRHKIENWTITSRPPPQTHTHARTHVRIYNFMKTYAYIISWISGLMKINPYSGPLISDILLFYWGLKIDWLCSCSLTWVRFIPLHLYILLPEWRYHCACRQTISDKKNIQIRMKNYVWVSICTLTVISIKTVR